MKVLQFQPLLMPHQIDFVMDDTTPIIGFVGGYRAGKSEAHTWKSLRNAAIIHPGKEGIMLAPIQGMNKRNILPILRRILPKTGLDYDVERLGLENPDRVEINVGGKISKIWLNVSAENYTRMNGMTLSWGGMDEADLCRSPDIAYSAFTELGNRISDGGEFGQQWADSTPEGLHGFMHRRFVDEASIDTKCYHVKMTDNYLLHPSYIERRLRNIPMHLHAAYVNGEFANIFTKTVYKSYDVELNDTDMTVEKANVRDLHVGMDFNIEHTAAIVHVIVGGQPYAVWEFVDQYDTEACCKAIQAKFPNHNIIVYPDASGKNRSAAGGATSHAIIRRFGFDLRVPNRNPGVSTDLTEGDGNRVNSMNAMFHNAMGQRLYKVNRKLCPVYSRCLVRQAWVKKTDDGTLAPDKSNNIDHPIDAGGYFIYNRWPLQNRPSIRQR